MRVGKELGLVHSGHAGADGDAGAFHPLPGWPPGLVTTRPPPYTYPAGHISEDPNQRRRSNAVKYTDWALGDFFHRASKESFFKNTIFAVVADHGARVYGSQTIPIHSYQIPLVVIGPDIKPATKCAILGSSLDVGPTLLGMVGKPYKSVFFGRDLLRVSKEEAWAVMNHNRDVSLYRNGELVVLSLNKTVELYKMDSHKRDIVPMLKPWPIESEIEKDAIALFQVADDLYMNERYKAE